MRRLTVLLLCLIVSACDARDSGYVAEVDAWHSRRLAALRSDTGELTQVGLFRLAPGSQSLGSAPDRDLTVEAGPSRLGVITLDQAGITFTAEPQVIVLDRASGEAVDSVNMATDRSGAPTVLASGSLLLHVIERGGTPLLRVRDMASPAPRAFTGVERFPVDPRWRVIATLVAGGGGTLEMANVLGQTTTSPAPGRLEFELEGSMLQLVPSTYPDGTLFIVFADATTGTETYAGGRFLRADPVGADGRVVLDFNKAYTPVCAFNAYSTCPLPPAVNTLPVAVRAGERHRDGK